MSTCSRCAFCHSFGRGLPREKSWPQPASQVAVALLPRTTENHERCVLADCRGVAGTCQSGSGNPTLELVRATLSLSHFQRSPAGLSRTASRTGVYRVFPSFKHDRRRGQVGGGHVGLPVVRMTWTQGCPTSWASPCRRYRKARRSCGISLNHSPPICYVRGNDTNNDIRTALRLPPDSFQPSSDGRAPPARP